MFTVSGKTIQYDRAWTHPDTGVHYPANWLRLTTLAEKQAVGLIEVTQSADQHYDQRFYWGVGNPKDHAQLQEQWVAQVKQTAGTLLAPTDWYIVRQSETNAAVPQSVLDRRVEIRQYSNDKEVAIMATADTDELAAYLTSAAFTAWEVLPEPEPAPELDDSGEDTIIVSGGIVSGGIV